MGDRLESYSSDTPSLYRVTLRRFLFLWLWKIERRHFEHGWGYLVRSRGVAVNEDAARSAARRALGSNGVGLVDVRWVTLPGRSW